MYRRARGLGQAPIDWSKVAWYEMPFIGIDAGVMKAYCFANPSDKACTPAPPAGAPPGAPQTPVEMTVPGAYTPDQSAIDAAAATRARVQAFFDQQAAQQGAPACDPGIDPNCADTRPFLCRYLGIGCDSSGTPGWLWAVGLTLAGVVVLGAVGGRR